MKQVANKLEQVVVPQLKKVIKETKTTDHVCTPPNFNFDKAELDRAQKVLSDCIAAYQKPRIHYSKAGQYGKNASEEAAKKKGKVLTETYDFESDNPSIYRVIQDKKGNVESLSEKTADGRITLTNGKNGKIIVEEESPAIAKINDLSAIAEDMQFPF